MSRSTKVSCGKLNAAKGTKTTTTQTGTTSGNSNTANIYGSVSPLDDPRYAGAVGKLGGFQFEHDPRIPNAFARERQQFDQSYANPMGGYSTPQLRDAAGRAHREDSAQNEAQALAEENYGFQGMRYAQAHDQATLSAPRVVQTGGSSTSSGTSSGTGTSVEQRPLMDTLSPFIQGGSAMGSAMLG